MNALTRKKTLDRYSSGSHAANRLGVRPYDRASGLLTALIVVLGTIVFLMVLAWLYMVTRVPPSQPIIFQMLDEQQSAPSSEKDDVESMEEHDVVVTEFNFAEALETITEVASTVQAGSFASVKQDGDGKGKQTTDQRRKGPDGYGPSGVNRLSVDFEVADKSEYAELLDYFKIDIGVLTLESGRIDYVTRFSGNDKPKRFQGSTKTERRNPVTPLQLRFREWDNEFVRAGGIEFDENGQIVKQFWSKELIDRLIQLEAIALANKNIDSRQVKKTMFEIKRNNDRFEIYVSQLRLRDGKTIEDFD